MSAAGEPTAQTRWPVVVAVLVSGIAAALQAGKVAAALPLLAAELQFGLVTGGWLVSLLGVIGATLGMAVGGIADRLGLRRVLLGGLALLALGSFAGAWADGAAALLFWRLIEGLGFICIVVVAPPIMFRAASARHNRLVFGIWGTYMSVGMALVLFGAPPLLERWGWRGLWIANAILLAVLLPAVAVASRTGAPTPATPRGALPGGVGAVLRRPGPPLLALCFASYTVNFFALMGFLPTYLVGHLGFTMARALPLVAVIALGNGAGALVTSWLLQRGAAPWALICLGSLSMGIACLGVFSGGGAETPRLLYAAVAVFVGALVPISVLASAPLQAPAPQLIGSTNGLFMQGSNVGQLLGPPVVGLAVGVAGTWQAAPVVMLAVSGCGALAALAVRLLGSGRQ